MDSTQINIYYNSDMILLGTLIVTPYKHSNLNPIGTTREKSLNLIRFVNIPFLCLRKYLKKSFISVSRTRRMLVLYIQTTSKLS